ncbi:MAG: hypothetical protein NTY02_20395 [Acidobacteria bacterium]|nr:hypothetical protein [Acidobacteriota bacterium]
MGGARIRSCPAPDPNALRRERDGAEWIHLPGTGREGPTPAWPLSKATRRELELWEREWRRPQAIEWERNGQQIEVASYVRCLRRAEGPTGRAADWTVVQRQQTYLGLTVPGLRGNRWVIDGGQVEAPPRPSRAASSGSARERFEVMNGGA